MICATIGESGVDGRSRRRAPALGAGVHLGSGKHRQVFLLAESPEREHRLLPAGRRCLWCRLPAYGVRRTVALKGRRPSHPGHRAWHSRRSSGPRCVENFVVNPRCGSQNHERYDLEHPGSPGSTFDLREIISSGHGLQLRHVAWEDDCPGETEARVDRICTVDRRP